MIFAKPILEKKGFHASDFINHICDERRDLGLEKYKGEELIVIDTNGGSGSLIYIDERIEHVLNDFIEENR